MEARLSTESGPIFMSAPEFLSSPFPVFRHVQLAGDLLIIPPRWYVFGVWIAQGLTLSQLCTESPGRVMPIYIVVTHVNPRSELGTGL